MQSAFAQIIGHFLGEHAFKIRKKCESEISPLRQMVRMTQRLVLLQRQSTTDSEA